MKISDLARQASATPTAVRFYESQGVLPPPKRSENGYRDYSSEDLLRLRIVVALRRLGLDLDESGRLAALCANDRCDEMATALLERVKARRAGIAAARADLDRLDDELAQIEGRLNNGYPDADSAEKGGTPAMCDCECPCPCPDGSCC